MQDSAGESRCGCFMCLFSYVCFFFILQHQWSVWLWVLGWEYPQFMLLSLLTLAFQLDSILFS